MTTQKYAVDVDGDGDIDYCVTIETCGSSNVASNVASNAATSNAASNITANIVTGPTTNLSSNAFSNANVLSDHDWFKDILYSKKFDDLENEVDTCTTNDSSLQGYPTYNEVLNLLDEMMSSIDKTDAKIVAGVRNAKEILKNNLG